MCEHYWSSTLSRQVPNLANAHVSMVDHDISGLSRVRNISKWRIFFLKKIPTEISLSTVETRAMARFGTWRD